MQPQQRRKPTQWESLAAGMTAGAVEGAATYPAEFLKTKAQFTGTKGAVSFECIPREAKTETTGRRHHPHSQRHAPSARRSRSLLGIRRSDHW